MKKKQQNLPVKTKQNEVITVNQEKTKTLDITNKLHHYYDFLKYLELHHMPGLYLLKIHVL